jgi:hypothetical protein
MGYYTSPFGNGVLTGSGGNVVTNVHNQFGPRDSGGTVGVLEVDGITENLIINVDGGFFTDVGNELVNAVIPAGSVIKSVYVDVEEAFALGGTSPTILIGTNGSEVTNGLVISKTLAEGTATTNITSTLAGTWDAEAALAADTTVGIALGGTNPTITRAGKLRVTIIYDRANLGL